MAVHERRVDIDDQSAAGQGQGAAGQPGGCGPDAGARRIDRVDRGLVAGREVVDDPRDRRVGRHLAEQAGTVPQDRDVRRALPSSGEHHREVADSLGRMVDRVRPHEPAQLDLQRLHQAKGPGGLGEQEHPRIRHRARRLRAVLDLRVAAGNVHSGSASPRRILEP